MGDTSGCRGVYKGRIDEEEQEAWLQNEAAQHALRMAITHALDLLYNQHEEVTFIAMYRKELLGELLSMAEDDLPARCVVSHKVNFQFIVLTPL